MSFVTPEIYFMLILEAALFNSLIYAGCHSYNSTRYLLKYDYEEYVNLEQRPMAPRYPWLANWSPWGPLSH